jgi:hypothetical protein
MGVSVMNSLLTTLVRFVLSTRAAVADSSRRTTLTAVLLLSVALPYTAQAYESKDELRLYAHSRIVDFKQFICFNKLINAESNWRIDAINGSHYGIGQMKNPKYRNLDGYRQVDWSLKYIKNRYSTPCIAWTFFEKIGGIDVKSLEGWKLQGMAKDSRTCHSS